MKQLLRYLLLALIVVSCDSKDEVFRLEGRFKSFNQGELYIYNLDQGKSKKDTIRLADGKFAYESAITDSVVYCVIFPNYSEIPVIARPGIVVKMEGDASHLKETKVTGSEENELLTAFRMDVNDQTPPQAQGAAEQFISNNPTAIASLYLLNKYFVQREDPDYKRADNLADKMVEANPTNTRLRQLAKQLRSLNATTVGQYVPPFSAVGINGRKVSNADLTSELNVVCVWASWNFDALSMQRQLKIMKRQYGQRLGVVGICLDGSLKDCRDAMLRDSVTWPTICDGELWQSPVVNALAITAIPSNLVIDHSGRIIARDLSMGDLRSKIETLLK